MKTTHGTGMATLLKVGGKSKENIDTTQSKISQITTEIPPNPIQRNTNEQQKNGVLLVSTDSSNYIGNI